jgi:hypothetical protein
VIVRLIHLENWGRNRCLLLIKKMKRRRDNRRQTEHLEKIETIENNIHREKYYLK